MENLLNEQIIKKIEALPPLPAAVQQLLRLTNDPDVSIHEVSHVISSDHAITSRILRVTNSAFYGFSRQISTVSQAIMMMGLDEIRNLALGCAILGLSKRTAHPLREVLDDFWRHTLAVATASRLIAYQANLHHREEIFVAGLLHDIGKAILMEHFHEAYSKILKLAKETPKPLRELEMDFFQLDHAEVGALICRHWKIPLSLSHVVECHHLPLEESDLQLESNSNLIVVQTANNLAKILPIGFSGNRHLDRDFLKILRMKDFHPEYLRQVLLELPEEIKKVEALFELPHRRNSDTETSLSSPPLVGVFLENKDESELIVLTLLSMGYQPIPFKKDGNYDPLLNAVIADSEAEKQNFLAPFHNSNVKIIDYQEWKEQHLQDVRSPLPITHLKDWLKRSIPLSLEPDLTE